MSKHFFALSEQCEKNTADTMRMIDTSMVKAVLKRMKKDNSNKKKKKNMMMMTVTRTMMVFLLLCGRRGDGRHGDGCRDDGLVLVVLVAECTWRRGSAGAVAGAGGAGPSGAADGGIVAGG